MKKFWIVSLMILFFVCGCEHKAVENEKYFLFATPLKEHKIWLKAKEGFDDACADYHINGVWKGPIIIDVDKMEEVIEMGIMQDADAIITQGVVSEEIIEKAYQYDIPVLLVDSDMPSSKRVAYMGKDFQKQAELLLAEIEDRIGEEEYLEIAIQVAEQSFNIAKEQIAQIETVFQKHPGGFEVVNVSESKSDSVRAKKEWINVLESYPNVNVAINFAGESAQFCGEAAAEKGVREQMLIYGVDDIENTLDAIQKDRIDGTVVTSFYDYGYKGVELLLDYINNGGIADYSSPELQLITKDNIKKYEEENQK